LAHPLILGAFLSAGLGFSVVWGLSLGYFYERSQVTQYLVLLAIGFTRRESTDVRALLLSAIYYGLGLLASLLFASVFGLAIPDIFAFSSGDIYLTIAGIVAEISLCNLLVDIGCRAAGWGSEKFAELREIPWTKGLRELPPKGVLVAAALGAVVEELFFRGIVLGILTDRMLVAPGWAVMIAGALFCLEQLLQVRTPFQAMVITSGCLAISVIGGLTVVITDSVIPAVICHVSFVIFFMTPTKGRQRT
jgi:membrane protease YdiL (CAAX protease family)